MTGQNVQPGAGGGAFTMSVSTKLVIEAVNVKDKQGKSVRGLTAKDFTVTEDGVKQERLKFCEYQEQPGGRRLRPAKPAPENVTVEYNRLAITQIADE